MAPSDGEIAVVDASEPARLHVTAQGAPGCAAASLGCAALFDGWDAASRQDFVGGPSVAFGMEWRR